MIVIRWGLAARVGLHGLSHEDGQKLAERWCGTIDADGGEPGGGGYRLVVPPAAPDAGTPEPRRISLRVMGGHGSSPSELRAGSHAVVLGQGANPDIVRYSDRTPPSPFERQVLIDMAVHHLLARQGLPVLHACAFELAGDGVLGLGESHSGKTTVFSAAMTAGGRVVSDDVVLAVPGKHGKSKLLPVRPFGWIRGRTRDVVPRELRDRMIEGDENGQLRWILNHQDGDRRFAPDSIPTAVWVQSVDRRLQESRIEAVGHGQVFAALIRASSPVYLSRHCPEVRDKLIPVFRALCEQCRGYRVRLGRRLLEDPEGEMTRLVGLSR